ncbi:MAG: hypothetical protein ABSD44_09040 [Terracidiphilus sp.]
MGEPMDMSLRVFGKLKQFEEVFPALEDAIVDFTEFDFLFEKRSGIWHVYGEGGMMPCGNPSCRRGGYEIDSKVIEMVRSHQTEKQITLYCPGDEGSPKGRKVGRRCQRKIEAKVTLRLKRQSESDQKGEAS